MRTRFSRCLRLSGVYALIALAIALTSGVTSAQNTCLQDEYNLVNKQKLNCTANDVRVAKVINIRNPDGSARFTCAGGETFPFVADFLVQTTSSESRSNIGLYLSDFDVSQQATALTGSCTDNVIAPPHHSSGISACLGSGASNDPTCTGAGTYEEFDKKIGEPTSTTGQTGCGDTASGDGTVCLSAPDPTTKEQSVVACPAPPGGQTFTGTQVITVEIPAFECPSLPAGSQVQLPNCTSWQVPGSVNKCVTSPPDYLYPFVANTNPSKPEAIPGSPSKCNCEVIGLPLIVQQANVVVQKACNVATGTGSSPNPPTFNPTATPPTQSPTTCDAGPEGINQVTYTIKITNASNTGGITINQVCDTEYGTIYRNGSYAGAPCAAGSATPGNISCGNLDIPGPINNVPQSAQCTFTATPSQENLGQGGATGVPALTDTASVVGVGDVSHSAFGPFSSNIVTVTSSDAPSSAKTTPAPTSTGQVCATERIHATVANTSGADETIFISALHDNTTVDLTTLSASIVGTTCGVSATANNGKGLGTEATSAAVPFPAAGIGPNNATYECDFDVYFCGAPGPVTTPGLCNTQTHLCSQGQSNATACSTDSDCNLSCTGIAHSDQLNATLAGDDSAPLADTISPIINLTGNTAVCIQTNSTVF